jgi:hypothetical protein
VILVNIHGPHPGPPPAASTGFNREKATTQITERTSAAAVRPFKNIQVDLNSLKVTKPHEYAVRFFFGGFITAAAGLIAKKYGPSIAGLFLAFPAIFPATATLIAKHEKQRKRKAGYDGTRRGRAVASVDAAGTSLGTIALAIFALIVWKVLPHHNPVFVLTIACFTWAVVSILLWWLRRLV